MKRTLLTLTLLLAGGAARADDDTAVRRVLEEEMSKVTRTYGGAIPAHHIAFTVYDVQRARAEAEQGATTVARTRRYRSLRVVVRAGDRTFDSSKFEPDFLQNTPGARGLVLEDDPEVLRSELAERVRRAAFRSALASLSGKRKVAGTARRPEDGPLDFADAPVASIVSAGPGGRGAVDLPALSRLTAELSLLAGTSIPQGEGEARGRHIVVRRRLLTSEGTWVDERRSFVEVRVQTGAQSTDGTQVDSEVVFTGTELGRLPPRAEMERAVREMAAEVPPLRDARAVRRYKAVVLFEPLAAASLLRHMLGVELSGTPPPFEARNRRRTPKTSTLADELGRQVAPPFIELADDPRVELGPGKVALFGHYAADEEGVAPARVSIVERSRLVSLPSSRTLRARVARPNGHARGMPHQGSYDGVLGNLFLTSKAGLSPSALRERAVATARALGPDTPVFIVRRMRVDRWDDETDGPIYFSEGGGGGGSHAAGIGRGPASLLPLVAYQLVDGREEPVRSLDFRGNIEGRRLADLVAVGQEAAVLNYFDRNYVSGDGELPIPASIVTPALLMTNIEVVRGGPRDPRALFPPPVLGVATCHALPLTGAPVRERVVAQEVPAPRGGTLRDGIYDGIADDYYVGPGRKEAPTENLRRRTIRISGNRIEFAIGQDEPEGVLLRTRGTFTTSGTSLRVVTECPRPTVDQISYSVLGDKLHFYDNVGGLNIDVYVRRP